MFYMVTGFIRLSPNQPFLSVGISVDSCIFAKKNKKSSSIKILIDAATTIVFNILCNVLKLKCVGWGGGGGGERKTERE